VSVEVQELSQLERALARCPDPDVLENGTFYGVPMRQMTRGQLLQTMWLLVQQSARQTVIVP
jgi:hypothetical protein